MSQVYDDAGETFRELQIPKIRTGGRRAMDRVLAGENQAIPYSVRLIFYILAAAVVMHSLVVLVEYTNAELLFAENGLLEWVQIIMLLLCSMILRTSSRYVTEIREGVYLLAIVPLMACVREMDQLLDDYVFDGAWQIIAIGLFLYATYFMLQHRSHLKPQIMRILAIPPTGLLFAGFITVMVFSRIFGQQAFWQYALQENYLRLVARITEESCEIFGYLLLIFGCVELLIFTVSCQKRTGQSIHQE